MVHIFLDVIPEPKIVLPEDQKTISKIQEFLLYLGLKDDLVNEYAIIYAADNTPQQIIGVIGRFYNNIRCLAIDINYQGNNVANTLVDFMVKRIYQNNFQEVFVFTKPVYFSIFRHLGFEIIYYNDKFGFLTNRYDLFERYLTYLTHKKNNVLSKYSNISAIVMNANPFTKGHEYLVQQASIRSDFVYVILVKEESSFFTYYQRFKMTCLGTKKYINVCILEGSNYLVSKNIFPSYFLPSKEEAIHQQVILDANIFSIYIADRLGIHKRFVGEEPFSYTTNLYNNIMKEVFKGKNLELIICPRITYQEKPISATQVRKLFIQGDFEAMSFLVPFSTLEYLKSLDYLKYKQNACLMKLVDKNF
ncbi:MAG: GNAT family N-acetyltransferase [Weeping tea tree witches'-broom phytoplasma]|uniref:GNAT family N-acetyltransferase n=1 Tax=Candidatus Phytoplasma melaleucae TaxID=2982630 RepID=UPI00293B469F|nr:GNAT family N-acetyltransferase [Weeping tea tree witches'-broom phytoplasma]